MTNKIKSTAKNTKLSASETKLSKYCLATERKQPNMQSQVGERQENSAMQT